MARLIEEDEVFKVLSAYYKHSTPVQDSALHDALSRVPSADLVNEWCTDCKEYDQTQHCCHRFTKVIRQTQEELKQNAVPVRRGEWVEYPYCLCYEGALTEDDIACSSCGAVFNVIDNCTETFKYCPNCGARMDKE